MDYNTQHTLHFIRKTLLKLPGTNEDVCYGTIAFYVNKKRICNLKQDGQTLNLYHQDRDELIAERPDIFFITNHYKNYPTVLIKLPLISKDKLKDLLINAWLLRANKTQVKQYHLNY